VNSPGDRVLQILHEGVRRRPVVREQPLECLGEYSCVRTGHKAILSPPTWKPAFQWIRTAQKAC